MRLIPILRYNGGALRETEDWVAEEGLLVLRIEDHRERKFAFSPEMVRPFVYGHLLGAGLIQAPGDVVSYRETVRADVGVPGEVIEVEVALRGARGFPGAEGVIWTSCGNDVPEGDQGLKPLSPRPLIAGEDLLGLPRLAAREAEDFRLTGAYHYAFLFDRELRIRAVAKDIGRHNAVDKVLGTELLAGGNLGERILFITGRISADIALKALRARVPVVASPGTALFGAISLARRYRLGLVGFLRGRRFNLYAGKGWLS